MRREPIDSEAVRAELAEIEAQITEEREARVGLGYKEAFLGKGNFIRFVIAFVLFFFQQWCGQNSVNYYAPRIFQSVSKVLGLPNILAEVRIRLDTQEPRTRSLHLVSMVS
jgi:hypothetical protein